MSKAWLTVVTAKLQRYQWLLWVVLIVLLAVGFDFKTPASQFREIRAKNAEQDSTILEQQSTIAELGRFVRALSIGQCLDRPQRETQLMGLPCDRLLKPTTP